MKGDGRFGRIRSCGAGGLIAAAWAGSGAAVFWAAPTEATMGPVQRVVYIHVAAAVCALGGFLATAGLGAAYLATRSLRWDRWLQATAEMGWLCGALTLWTGSIWAREAWGTWWTWDPRLTSAFLLWVVYGSILLVRSEFADPHRRARVSAVLAAIGAADVPLVIAATRWFRSIHPASVAMEPAMRCALAISILAFGSLCGWLVYRRGVQLDLEHRIESLEYDQYNVTMTNTW